MDNRPMDSLSAKAARPFRRAARTMRRWALGADADAKLARWKVLADTGEALTTLKASAGWTVLMDLKRFSQVQCDLRLRSPSSMQSDGQARSVAEEDRRRFQASVEWAALEGFFREIDLRIRAGHTAAKALAAHTPDDRATNKDSPTS